ncbi:hypothetical protein ES707_05669 [subsurface metagenome]
MISGIRKAPPISMSCPRDTMTSFPFVSVFRIKSVAPALLLTMIPASAPVKICKRRLILRYLSALLPCSSICNCEYPDDTEYIISAIPLLNGARPNPVCSTIPKALTAWRKYGVTISCNSWIMFCLSCSNFIFLSEISFFLKSSIVYLMIDVRYECSNVSRYFFISGHCSILSTAGILRRMFCFSVSFTLNYK